MSAQSPTYIPVVEAAKIIRTALKTKHPDTKFSVVTSKYAGGSSIRIALPKDSGDDLYKEVQDMAHSFAGTGFDGMIDMSFYKDAWLNRKTGEARPAKSSGTTGSRGVYEPYDNPAPSDEFELVHFGASHIFVEREWR